MVIRSSGRSPAGLARVGVGIVLAAFLAPAPGAFAQGTSGTMPPPITSVDLAHYADWLHLTPAQRVAAEAVHDEYKQRFQALREGEIAQFLDAMRAMQDGGMVPKRDAVETFMDKLDKLQARIKSLDDAFFSQLEAVLDDEQRPGIEHPRLARARERCRSDMFMGMGQGPRVDLSAIYWEIELPAEAHAQSDPMIATYERQLTRRMLEMHEASAKAAHGMSGIYEETGLEGMTQEQLMADPQRLTKLMEQVQQRMAELMQPVLKESTGIAELNRRTLRQVTAILPGPAAGALRQKFLTKAYSELGTMPILGQEPWVRSAEEATGLTAAQRAQVAAIIDTYRLSANRLVDEAIELIDAHRAVQSPFAMDPQANQDYYGELTQRQARGQELAAAARRDLEVILGEGQPGNVAKGPDGQQVLGNAELLALAKQKAIEVAGEDGDAAAVVAAKAGDAGGARAPDTWLPPPISAKEITQFIERLALDETLRSIIRQMHGDYTAEITKLPAIAEVVKASQGLWQIDPATGQARMADERTLQSIYDLRRRAFAAMNDRDQAFFETFQTFVVTEQQADVGRLRRARERLAYRTVPGMQMFAGEGSKETSVDVVEICQGDTLTDQQRLLIEPIIAAYESAVIPVLRARYDGCLNRQQAMERFSAAMQGAEADQSARMEMAIRFQQALAEAAAPVREAGSRLAELNRQTMEAVAQALPEAQRSTFRRSYFRQGFPSVYTDPASVEEHLSRAMTLRDLSTDQLAAISSLAGTYWIDYEALSQKMVAVTDAGDFMFSGPSQADMVVYMHRKEELEKLRFSRDELTYRAISRLQGLLREEQVSAIGGLPKPQAREERKPWE